MVHDVAENRPRRCPRCFRRKSCRRSPKKASLFPKCETLARSAAHELVSAHFHHEGRRLPRMAGASERRGICEATLGRHLPDEKELHPRGWSSFYVRESAGELSHHIFLAGTGELSPCPCQRHTSFPSQHRLCGNETIDPTGTHSIRVLLHQLRNSKEKADAKRVD